MADRCEAGDRCRMADSDGQPHPQWPLCDWEFEPAERDVRALVLDYRDLEQLLPPSLGVWGDGQPRGKSNPLPVRAPVLDLQHEIWYVLGAWEDVLRDVDGLSPAPDWAKRRREGYAVEQSVRIVAPRLHLLAKIATAGMWRYPGWPTQYSEVPGWRGVLDLVGLHSRARSALGLSAPEPDIAWGVRCRNIDCDYISTLVRLPGKHDGVRCRKCGYEMTTRQFNEWCVLSAAPFCGREVGGWVCGLLKRHSGPCEPARTEDAA